MAPEHVRQIEERWLAIRGIQYREHRLEKTIQVYGNHVAAELQQIIARVPPSMKTACRQIYGSARWHNELFRPHLSTELACLHDAVLVFMEMYVQGRPTCSRRQAAIEEKDYLSLGVSRAAQHQYLAGMAVFQPQKVVHESPQGRILSIGLVSWTRYSRKQPGKSFVGLAPEHIRYRAALNAGRRRQFLPADWSPS